MSTFVLPIKKRRIKFSQADVDTLITMHKRGDILDDMCQVLDRPMGTIATKVRELIKKGVLLQRLQAATGPRLSARKPVEAE